MFVRLPLHLTIVASILKVMKTPMFQITDMISILIFDNHKTEHPFAGLLRGDWQSLRQKNKLRQNKNYSCFRAMDRMRFFSIKWPGYVTYNVNFHYSSNIENISFHFSFIQTRYLWFWMLFHFSLSFVSCDCSLKENYQSTFSHFHNRNAN